MEKNSLFSDAMLDSARSLHAQMEDCYRVYRRLSASGEVLLSEIARTQATTLRLALMVLWQNWRAAEENA